MATALDKPHPLSTTERKRLRDAAFYAPRAFPGAVGEMISRELFSWENFGYRLGSTGLIHGLVEAVEAALMAGAEPLEEAA